MTPQIKTSLRLAFSFIISSLCITPLNAQQVKKTTTPQKKTTTVTKKPVTTKRSTASKTTTITKAKPVLIQKPVIETPKMTARELQMVEEINLVRANPTTYIKHIKEWLARTNAPKHTLVAANELMEELKRTIPMNALKINTAMYLDARKYGLVMMENNYPEHSDLPYAENLSFGIENIREAIIDLLIDEEIPDRGHRKNILSRNISFIAVHELPGKVDDFNYCYIQEFK